MESKKSPRVLRRYSGIYFRDEVAKVANVSKVTKVNESFETFGTFVTFGTLFCLTSTSLFDNIYSLSKVLHKSEHIF